jgi:arylsulfatase A-like enzyme
MTEEKKLNVVFVFSDQHRGQAMGYAGDLNVKTPNFDQLARESVNCSCAVSTVPVCGPTRASLLTGQYPLKHGVFVNDVPIGELSESFGYSFRNAGYNTGYIGKWHIDGHGRNTFIPENRRLGFDFWRVSECTHNYNDSHYYGEDDELKYWTDYDAGEQTECAIDYIRRRDPDKPFALFLSWGPPHNPYETAPKQYRDMYQPETIKLRNNVPAEWVESTKKSLSGYYAHITALDEYMGRIMAVLKEEGIEGNTILVYTSDHGDMLNSQGMYTKQKPWDESIIVPFLIRWPNNFIAGSTMNTPLATEDIMPTILDLCGINIPNSVQGENLAYCFKSNDQPDRAALIASIAPMGNSSNFRGVREFRGVRTSRYTYVRNLNGPWLLYDNVNDPYQMNNLCGATDYAALQTELDDMLKSKLQSYEDEFKPAEYYVTSWGYQDRLNEDLLLPNLSKWY